MSGNYTFVQQSINGSLETCFYFYFLIFSTKHFVNKVVQYYMYRTSNDAADNLEDDEGHGTHVAGSK